MAPQREHPTTGTYVSLWGANTFTGDHMTPQREHPTTHTHPIRILDLMHHYYAAREAFPISGDNHGNTPCK